MRQTFTKDERLCKKILIAKLFREGHSFFLFPFRVIYLQTTFVENYPVQLLISVPKNNFRKAVQRNRLKRMIREAYRTNKEILYESLTGRDEKLLLCISYACKEILTSDVVKEKIKRVLVRLSKGHENSTG